MQALAGRIDGIRAHLQGECDAVPAQRAALAADRARARELAQRRGGIRKATLLLRDCERRARELDTVASGAKQRQFEQRVIPFIQAQGEMVASGRATAAEPACRRLPGGQKRRRVSDMAAWTQQASIDGSVVREFMAEFEGAPAEVMELEDEQCGQCGGRLLVVERKATLCCEACGASTPHIDLSVCSQGARSDIEFVAQTYKRSNHFLEWLNQLQAKESTVVADSIIADVMRLLYDGGARSVADVAPAHVRGALKKLRLRAEYEHVCQITCRITGAAPPRLSGHIEERLRLMFIAAQEPFDLSKGRRKNFLSYSYTLQQFMRLIGVGPGHIGRLAFTLLKGRDKLDRQNMIYEKMCAQLDWEFSPIGHAAA